MNNKIKTFRKITHHNERQDLYQISYRVPTVCQQPGYYEPRRKMSKKYPTEVESDEEIYEPPTRMIDIAKLPNGQFKDQRYSHTDEKFFVQMGGKNRTEIAQKLKQSIIDHSSPYKCKGTKEIFLCQSIENPFFNQIIIKRALDTQNCKRSMTSIPSSISSGKLKPLNVIEFKPIEINISVPPRTPSFTSARQKLFKILYNK